MKKICFLLIFKENAKGYILSLLRRMIFIRSCAAVFCRSFPGFSRSFASLLVILEQLIGRDFQSIGDFEKRFQRNHFMDIRGLNLSDIGYGDVQLFSEFLLCISFEFSVIRDFQTELFIPCLLYTSCGKSAAVIIW